MKKLSIRQMATVKRVAQSVNPLVIRKNKIQEEIKKLNEECNNLIKEIEGFEGGIIALTGHVSEDLVTKVVETTDKLDKKGCPIKVTKYVPTSLITFNEEERCYYIMEAEMPEAGNDYDLDALMPLEASVEDMDYVVNELKKSEELQNALEQTNEAAAKAESIDLEGLNDSIAESYKVNQTSELLEELPFN